MCDRAAGAGDRHKDLSDYLPLPGSGCIFAEEQTTHASMTPAPPVLLDDECFEYPPDDARCSCRTQVQPLCSVLSTEGAVRADSALLGKSVGSGWGWRGAGPWGDAATPTANVSGVPGVSGVPAWPISRISAGTFEQLWPRIAAPPSTLPSHPPCMAAGSRISAT
jgi:hypothetical protein